ncbi:exodeoxyribonuclease-3 [Friedmanniella endophytica]|uniref:Exodeoxyribonuclease-3 n=1 Tax=Microlunatus kandeliicorticis TaxID=1759536 RepID=A0A7W3IQW4_9ACTN|nr:exodeoxyribonuclease III [Microlunatus kandeliicorticis]MBA8793578.1 exodeoxyribonuclease-3 [Microlunatus kandeliicorticis]
MRIATWNVNSVGARLPRLLDWLETREPDVVALQETKCGADAFPTDEVGALGYTALPVGGTGTGARWNGVAVLSRVGLEPVATRLADFEEPRYVSAVCSGLTLTSVYVPNGRTIDDPHYAYKLDWLAALRATLDDADPDRPMIITGDFNVAPTDADVFAPEAFVGSTHVTEPERAAVRALVDWGLTDVPARPGKGDRPFTYWDYRAGMFHKDQGMRIDLVLASRGVRVTDAWVDREARKGKGPSDHAPVVVDLEL